ncbi:interleukin-1 receptor-associated kinase 3 isoform X2 [Triplophysa dalaica]|uniref:interleukin-1 receptor-associated kinase 3 isoform X2 n=1 Tax=Triplophysa dalaica TaxID=1582913 RepID=UPI0024E02A42|nr:interleukin-1 receptor-associated kinase 3 isoform X2 [Triplophysa dalaica]
MAGTINPSMFLFDVPPLLMRSFCKLMDSGVDGLGWRDLAFRILPSLLDVRCIETCSAGGKSPTQELIWSWAQQNKTVGDLLKVLDQMGHVRARSLFFQSQDWCTLSSSSPPIYPTHLTDREKSFKPSAVHPEFVCDKGEKQKYLITFSDVTEGTRHFHHDLKIGGSAFAEVYCGRWGNQSFAVKVFKQESKAAWKGLWEKFTKEIEVLQLYQHPHILELWGSFSKDDRFCLVYPYLQNGSLFHRLHEEVKRPLSWQERLNIIKGTAKAVHHLHTAQPCTVICGNITSSNILLDENLQPKLSDFGLAHLRPHTVNQSCTIVMDTASRSHLGYLPEEYIRDGKLSVKLDVYSYGMVVLETCTGQKVKQESAKTSFLRDLVRSEFEEKGCVDACLQFLDPKVDDWPPSVALCLFRIGLECTSSRMRVRPGMDTVLEMLSQLLPIPTPPEDQPHTLDDRSALQVPYSAHGLAVSMPTEDDELYSPVQEHKACRVSRQSGPCECSQSEVTFLSVGERCSDESLLERDNVFSTAHSLQSDVSRVDLYGSLPVECSCTADAEAQGCEDCCANGFNNSVICVTIDDDDQSSHDDIRNPAKEKMRNKIHLYNQGLIKTEELLSLKLD